MKKIARLLLTSSVFVLSVVVVTGQSTSTIAQLRGQGTEPFFDRGNQQIEREIQRLQRQQVQEEEDRNQALELENQNNTDPKNPNNSQVEQEESVPSIDTDVDSNKPESFQQKQRYNN